MRTKLIDITYDSDAENGFQEALDRICTEADTAITEGFSFVILSDRNISSNRIPLSALVACGAVHHHLVRSHQRSRLGLIIETGEAREVHHFCLLTGYGADAINPYLAFEALWQARNDGLLGTTTTYDTEDSLVYAYKKAVAKGILKVWTSKP